MSDEPPVYPFHVGVVAPPGFDAPGLADALRLRLVPLLRERRRHQPVALWSVMGEPASVALAAVAPPAWLRQTVCPAYPLGRGVFRASFQLATLCDALVVLGGPELPPPFAWLVRDACPRLGTAVRVVRVG